MVRFQRFYSEEGGYAYRVIESAGSNPIEKQDTSAIATIEDELEAARLSGHPTNDPNQAFIEPEQVTYPLAYERIAQLFDSPNAPDLAVNAKCFTFGKHAGEHGTLDVVQSRATLTFSGPGVRSGVSNAAARHIDIAPTIARLMGMPTVAGRDATGRQSSDVYFRRQDGRPLDEILDLDTAGELQARPERVYIFHLDGLSNSELRRRLEDDPAAIPNLRRIIERGHMFRYGSIVNFPSVTWPGHNVLGTGCWAGHHDIVNNHYYLRQTREPVSPFDQRFETSSYLSDDVETLYEAFHRVYGAWDADGGAFTAAIHEPCGREADHAVLERRTIGDRERLRALTKECEGDINSRWLDDNNQRVHDAAFVDNRGIAQALVLYSEDAHPPPIFMYHQFTLTDSVGHDYGPHHEAMRIALDETDRRIGRVLQMLEERAFFDSTLFIIASDHGMAPSTPDPVADQMELLARAGMKAVTRESFIYLLDLAVEIERSRDGASARVMVRANDADISGERPAVSDAEVELSDANGRMLLSAPTDRSGITSLSLPPNLALGELVITVRHEDYNPCHLRLNGSSVVLDLRQLLYGDGAA